MIVWGPGRRGRICGVVLLFLTAMTVLLQMFLANLYFGSPLPLPFYLKAKKAYGAFIYEQYRGFAARHFADYLSSYGHLFALTVAGVFLDVKNRLRGGSVVERGLATATGIFLF